MQPRKGHADPKTTALAVVPEVLPADARPRVNHRALADAWAADLRARQLEIRDLIASLGFTADSVQQTTDRHWTWSATKN